VRFLSELWQNSQRPFRWLLLCCNDKYNIKWKIFGRHDVSGDCFDWGYKKKYGSVTATGRRCLGPHNPIFGKCSPEDKRRQAEWEARKK
jgi:hypothetical protein